MDFLRSLLAACAVLMAVSTFVRADSAPADTDRAHVHTAILANVSSIAPRQTFWIGVQLTLESGWHVYWTNPGDAGLPTQVKFDLPKGFVLGELRYPTPIRIEQPGNIVMYGYKDSVMLMAQVTAPADVPASTDISAKVSWLVCADDCIPGKTDVLMTLPKASGSQGPEDHADLFKDWLAQVPDAKCPAVTIAESTTRVNGMPTHNSLDITWKHPAPDSVEFLPGELDDYTISGVQVTTTGDTTDIAFSLQLMAGHAAHGGTFPAVIGYQTSQGHRGSIIQISLPKPG